MGTLARIDHGDRDAVVVETPIEANQALIDARPLAAALRQFADEREWGRFHSPKNLVMALSGEVGELSEVFQWMTEDASKSAGTDASTAQAVRDEIADVMLYLVRLADVLGVDLNEAVSTKLRVNESRYPIADSRGSSRKYTQL